MCVRDLLFSLQPRTLSQTIKKTHADIPLEKSLAERTAWNLARPVACCQQSIESFRLGLELGPPRIPKRRVRLIGELVASKI